MSVLRIRKPDNSGWYEIGSNAQIIAGDGLSGGGPLTNDVSLKVALSAISGLRLAGTVGSATLEIDDAIAGAGLTIANKALSIGAGPLIDVSADGIGVSSGLGPMQLVMTDPSTFQPTWTSLSAIIGDGLAITAANKLIVQMGASSPSTITPDAANEVGVSALPPHADHVHAIATAAPTANSVSLAASGKGSATSFSRSDHTHQLDLSIVPSWTGLHTFAPSTTRPPFALGSNAQGQTVAGLKADQLNKTVTAGSGLTGGGALASDVTLNVGAGTLITVAADTVGLSVGTAQYQVPVTGASPFTPAYTALSTFAGGGLVFSSGVFAVGAGTGITVNADDVSVNFGTPTISTITPDDGASAGTSGNPARSDHKHAIVAAAPNANSVNLSASAEGTGTSFARADHTHQLDIGISPTWTGLHTIQRTTEQLRLAYDSTHYASFAVDSNGGLTVTPVGSGAFSFPATMTARTILPETIDAYDLGSTAQPWRSGYLSELRAMLFAQSTTLIGGTFSISKGEGKLPAAVTAAATTIDFGQAMTVGDFVCLRAPLTVEYILVGALVSGTTYNVTRNLDGSGADAWGANTVYQILGQNGNARIDLDATSTPRISLIGQGSAYNAQTERLRIGDLNGGWGYGAETWGIALGEYASGKANLTLDPTNGLRLRSYTTVLAEIKNDGTAKLGGWNLGATSLTAGSGATTVGLDSGGTNPAIYAGSATPGSAPFRVTQAGGLTATSATITGTINATAGYFGSGSTRVAVESAGLNVGNTGSIRGGQTAYNTGTGFWLGYSSTAYMLSIGNPSGNRITWDGTNLSIVGSVTITGGSGYANLADKPSLGTLAAKNSVDLATSDVANKSLANLDTTANTKLSGIAAGATVGATWGTNLSGIPATLQAPSGSGLFLSATNMGYYNGSAWKTYLDNTGKFYLKGTNGYLTFDPTADTLTIKGAVTITSGSGYASLADKPTSLSGINSTEGSKLSGIEAGADVTSGHTALNTSNVGTLPASTVQGWAAGSDTTMIDGGKIYADSVTATQILVANLSALSADMGALTAGSIVIGSTNKLWLNDAADGALNIGGSTKASAPFRVTAAGALTATNAAITGTVTATAGRIADWNITANNLYHNIGSDTVAYLYGDASFAGIGFGKPAPNAFGANVGVFIGYDTTSLKARLSLYSDASNYLQWDGSRLTVKATNFSLDASGNLSATNATLSGTITATSGSIDGLLSIGAGGSIEASGVTLNENGISVTAGAGFWDQNAYTFTGGGHVIGGLYGSYSPGGNTFLQVSSDGSATLTTGQLWLRSRAFGKFAQTVIDATSATGGSSDFRAWIDIGADPLLPAGQRQYIFFSADKISMPTLQFPNEAPIKALNYLSTGTINLIKAGADNNVWVGDKLSVNPSSGAVNAYGQFSTNGNPLYIPSAGTESKFMAGTGDGGSLTTYNVKLKIWWGLAFAGYDEVPHFWINCRTGEMTTDGWYAKTNYGYAVYDPSHNNARIQYGITYLGSRNPGMYTDKITMPYAYSSGNTYVVQARATERAGNADLGGAVYTTYESIPTSTTQFSVRWNQGYSSALGSYIHWIAIGT